MNRKGLIFSETGELILAGIILVVIVSIIVTYLLGGFSFFSTLMPNFDKPAATEIALTGLIKYDVSANPVLQYYDGVNFQNFDVKNGEQVLVIGDKAFRYAEVQTGFSNYYLNGNRKSDGGIRLTGTDASDIVNDLGITNKPGEVSVVAMEVCDANCVDTIKTNNLGILSTITPGDVKVGVYGKLYELYVFVNTKKIIYSFGSTAIDKRGTEIGSGKSYADKIWTYASGWRDSVIGGPIKLNIYDYKNTITSSCKEYSFPVSKVKSLQGNGFVLTANLAKGTSSGECKGNVA